ncbi:MAG: TonB-dependent receptor [Alphaproteobacteria bacterium]|nr:TonB-dependent receptor [Alphaproteobacteria bacterium]
MFSNFTPLRLTQNSEPSSTTVNPNPRRLIGPACFAVAALTAAPAFAQQAVVLEGIIIEGGSALLEPLDAGTLGNSVSVVTAEELEQRQVRTVADALRTVPGVAVNRSGSFGGFTQIRIRGSEENHTLVLIDGVEANDATNGAFDFGSLLAEDIERIEVIRGPQSGIWGSSALAGVVNIVTRSGRDQPLTATASVEGGAFDTRQLSASVRGGNEFAHASVSIVDAETHGFNVSPFGDEADGAERRNISARGGINLTPWLAFEGVVNKLDNVAQIDGFGAAPGARPGDFAVAFDLPGSSTTTDALYAKGTARLAFFDDAWVTKIYGDFSRNDVDTVDPFFVSFNGAEREKFGVVSSYTFEQPVFGGLKHTFVALYEDETESFATNAAAGGFERETDSVAGEYRGEFADQFFVRGAVRGDKSEAFGDFTTYSVSGAWQVPGTGTRLHSSYGTGVVFPTLFDQFGVIPSFFVGNPNLLPEESKGYDVGVEQALWQRRAVVDVTYFNQNLENEVFSSFFGPPVNLAEESKRQGIEVTASVRPIDGLIVSGSYTYLDASGGNGLAEVRRPEHSGSLNVSYAFAEGRGAVNLGVIYNGSMDDIAFDAFTFAQNRVNLREYTVVNLSAHYDLSENVRLFGRVENLLDEDYQEVFGFESAPVAAFGGVRIKLGGTRDVAGIE